MPAIYILRIQSAGEDLQKKSLLQPTFFYSANLGGGFRIGEVFAIS